MNNKIFIQLNDALKTMRDNNYIHRDLKPENILIKYTDDNRNNFDIKLSDFGFSTKEINSSFHTFSNVGTRNYMDPQIETNNYNNKCDLWSLGVLLYELYTNKNIFYYNNQKKETKIDMKEKSLKKLIMKILIN